MAANCTTMSGIAPTLNLDDILSEGETGVDRHVVRVQPCTE